MLNVHLQPLKLNSSILMFPVHLQQNAPVSPINQSNWSAALGLNHSLHIKDVLDTVMSPSVCEVWIRGTLTCDSDASTFNFKARNENMESSRWAGGVLKVLGLLEFWSLSLGWSGFQNQGCTLNRVLQRSTSSSCRSSKVFRCSQVFRASWIQWDSFPRPAPNSTKHRPLPSSPSSSMWPKMEDWAHPTGQTEISFTSQFNSSAWKWDEYTD